MNYIDCKLKILDLKGKICDLESEKEDIRKELDEKIKRDKGEFIQAIRIDFIKNYAETFKSCGLGAIEKRNSISIIDIIKDECQCAANVLNDRHYEDSFRNIVYNIDDEKNKDDLIKLLQFYHEKICNNFGTMYIPEHNYSLRKYYKDIDIEYFKKMNFDKKYKNDKSLLKKEWDIAVNNIIFKQEIVLNTQKCFKDNSQKILSYISDLNNIEDKIFAKSRIEKLDMEYEEKIKTIKELITELEMILPKLKEKILNV